MSQVFFERNGNTMTKIVDGFRVNESVHEKPLLEQMDFFVGAMDKIIADKNLTDREKRITCANIIHQLAIKCMFNSEDSDFDSDESDDDDSDNCADCDQTDCPSHPNHIS